MSKSNLPANISGMATALAASLSQAGAPAGNDLYMKFAKGEWSFGSDDTEPEEGSIWAINPTEFQHGFISWGSKERGNPGTMTGERMVPAMQPMPLEGELPAVNGDWTKAVAMQMRCTNGEDEGVQVLYKTNSHGGRKVYAAILQAFIERINQGEEACVPLVTLGSDSYKHTEYGKVYTPVIEIADWMTMDGVATEEAEEPALKAVEQVEEPEEAPKKTRRRTRKPA